MTDDTNQTDERRTGVESEPNDGDGRPATPVGSDPAGSISSRERKSGVEPVDPREVLAGVERLAVARWEYDDRPGVTHMGPMAEEFNETFGLGADHGRITAVDADGVAFAAIQGLASRLDERTEQAAALRATVEDQADRINALERDVERKDARISAQADRIVTLERRLARLREDSEALRERLSAVEAHLGIGGDAPTPADD